MVRWLTKDPGLDPVQITLPDSPGSAGRQFEIRVQLREGDLPPNLRSTVSLSVSDPEGLKMESNLKPTGQPGEYLGSFLPSQGGIYKVRVETGAGSLEESVVVTGLLESLDAAPDPGQLKAIAEATGGKLLSGGEDLQKEIESYARKAETRFIEERRSPVWATTYALVLVLGCLIPEWYFRRRWGLV